MTMNGEMMVDQDKLLQSALGGQDWLHYNAVPTTATQTAQSVDTAGDIGQRLIDTPKITVAGTYTVLIPLSGMVSLLQVPLTATIVHGTVTTSLSTLYKDRATAKTAGGGGGVMVSGTRQTLTVTTLAGEQYALLTIVVADSGGVDVTFTQAEYNGL